MTLGLRNRSATKHVLCLSRSRRSFPASQLRWQLGLHRAAHLQRLAEPLVLDDSALIHPCDPVEGAVGQGQALVADLNSAVREVIDDDLLPRQGARDLVGLEDEHHPVVLNRQRVGDGPFHALGEAAVEIVQRRERPVHILVVPGGLGEAAVVVGHEGREQGVAGLDVVGAGQTQLLHQAVLQRLVGALDPTLGLRRAGAQVYR